jgi:hypothetical protein
MRRLYIELYHLDTHRSGTASSDMSTGDHRCMLRGDKGPQARGLTRQEGAVHPLRRWSGIALWHQFEHNLSAGANDDARRGQSFADRGRGAVFLLQHSSSVHIRSGSDAVFVVEAEAALA